MGDRHDGRSCNRVPDIVFGAHDNRIVTAIPIIPSTRGFERNGDGVTPIRAERDAAARLELSIFVQDHICGAARIHPEPPGSSVIVPDTVTGTNFPFGGHNTAGFAEMVISCAVVSSPKQVARKTSRLPSGFSLVRSALEEKAMRVPLSLIVGESEEIALPVLLVTWVKVVVVVSKRKTSELPSGFCPVRSALDIKAMRVPLPLIVRESEALPWCW